MSAAGIKQIRPPDAAEGQQLVGVMLHRKFKKEQRRDEKDRRKDDRRDARERRRDERDRRDDNRRRDNR